MGPYKGKPCKGEPGPKDDEHYNGLFKFFMELEFSEQEEEGQEGQQRCGCETEDGEFVRLCFKHTMDLAQFYDDIQELREQQESNTIETVV